MLIPVEFFLVPSEVQDKYEVEMEAHVVIGQESNGNPLDQITSQMSKQTLDDKPAEGEVTRVVFDPDGVSGSFFSPVSAVCFKAQIWDLGQWAPGPELDRKAFVGPVFFNPQNI